MSQASAQSDARASGANRDTISGGSINPIVAGILAVMVAIVALMGFLILGRKGGK